MRASLGCHWLCQCFCSLHTLTGRASGTRNPVHLLGLVILSTWPVQAYAAKPDAQHVATQVDKLIAEELFSDSTKLAPPTNDATYLRRVWLDLVGDIPTPEHVTAFVLDPDPTKRERVVRELLKNPQFGQHWARYWRDVILYRRIEERSLIVANPLVVKLTEQFNQDRPWDEIAAQFITARGDVKEDGATAVIVAQEGRTEETTAEMARILLGMQIQCAQCHDHPYDRWKREEFHELAAFFPRIGLRQVLTPTRRSFEVVTNDRPTGRRRPGNDRPIPEPEHFMSDLDDPAAQGTRMQPKFFLTGAELSYGTPDADRRGQLAEWLTDNPWFATAYVNRMWGELVGEGFYEPIDDLGPDRTPSAPKAVDYLSKQFATSGYDVKWLMRVICSTEAYQRESRPRREAEGTAFAANVAQRLRGDQLFNALLTALDAPESEGSAGRGRPMGGGYGFRATPRTVFNTVFGYDPSEPRDSITPSITQALAMMNTPQINLATVANRRTSLGKLAAEIDDEEELVTELYLRCLSREPTEKELAAALAYRESIDSRPEAVEDLFWALLNSSEFTHRR
ncbi:MAG: DUF1549 domain-containing protein [Pirellulales bacterium]